MNLVLIETSGNQNYIFATNKLAQNVGASQLTHAVGTDFVLEAVRQAGGAVPKDRADAATYPVLSDENPIEVIVAVSGKALLLVRRADIGRQIVRAVTLRALREAPGLEVRGVVSPDFELGSRLHEVLKAVHREYEAIRSRLPIAATRFQRLPVIAECDSSGLPATELHDSELRSAEVQAKVQAADPGLKRIRRLLHDEGQRLPFGVSDLEKLGCEWLAVVHADGNGLGQIFLSFDERARTTDDRDYITKLRAFSLALEDSTVRACRRSLAVLVPTGKRQQPPSEPDKLPIVPLVLGGDDLTVVCDGRQALRFTKEFTDAFEAETRNHPDIHAVLPDGVTSCAGVAIIKPHFPFFAAYELAEELLWSAKQIAKQEDPKKPASAIDYHVLYDASGADLERIRRELTVDGGQTVLVGRPYVTTNGRGPAHRRWLDLQQCIKAVRATDDDQRRKLPNSMLHDLREALFLGRMAADARLRLVLDRYRNQGLDQLLGAGNSLFWKENTAGTETYRTALLDAVDTAEFWEE
ncbi:MAG: hypothetical protein NZ700_00990 [Gemmataceae bacterium]|nr:hypothetical protein [Gemmataceae bacterium]MDW8265792.1 hypothetical protein [Gemmataceae bacterium]